jgi:hypothetical protein
MLLREDHKENMDYMVSMIVIMQTTKILSSILSMVWIQFSSLTDSLTAIKKTGQNQISYQRQSYFFLLGIKFPNHDIIKDACRLGYLWAYISTLGQAGGFGF